MGNVTKKKLVEVIANRTGLTQVDTKIIIENLLETISKFLQNGRNIEIRGFGRFKVKKKKGRIARNPRTGETVNVKEGLKPIFEASKELKKKVNDEIPSKPSQEKEGAAGASDQSSEPIY
jgi:DNA-binding protein HU-beta/integration host factor subunit beta